MVENAQVAQEVVEAFAGVVAKKLRWVTAKVEGESVVLAASGARESTLEELVAAVGD